MTAPIEKLREALADIGSLDFRGERADSDYGCATEFALMREALDELERRRLAMATSVLAPHSPSPRALAEIEAMAESWGDEGPSTFVTAARGQLERAYELGVIDERARSGYVEACPTDRS